MADKEFFDEFEKEILSGNAKTSPEQEEEIRKMEQGRREALLQVNESGVIFDDDEEVFG